MEVPEDLQQKGPRKILIRCWAFNLKEQQFYSEVPPDVQTLYPISKSDLGHPAEEDHLNHLYLWSFSFGIHPKLMTTEESEHRLADKLRILSSGLAPSSPLQFGIMSALVLMLHQSTCQPKASFYPHFNKKLRVSLNISVKVLN